jgi:capsular exopolysaccharide synthesis family protein
MTDPTQNNGTTPNGQSGNSGRYRGEYPATQYNGTGFSGFNESSDEIDLRQVFGLLWHNKIIIVAAVIIGALSALFYAQAQIPIYESNGSLQISEAGLRYSMAGSDISNLLVSNFGIGMGSTIENEIHILRSRTFTRELAQRLHDERFQPDGRLFPLLWEEFPDDSTLVDSEVVFRRLMGKIEFSRADRSSNLLRVAFRSPSPYEASRVVDMAIETYTDVSTRINRSQARNAIEFLNSELDKVSTQLESSEEALREFMNDNQLVQLDTQSNQLISTLSALEAEAKGLNVQLVGVNSSLEAYKVELDRLTPGLSEQISQGVSPRLNQLQIHLAERETQLTLLYARNPDLRDRPDDPAVVGIMQQIVAIREQVGQLTNELIQSDTGIGFLSSTDGNVASRFLELRNRVLTLEIQKLQYEAQQRLLETRVTELQRIFDDLPDNMIEMARHRRNMQMSERLFMLISQQAAETALWEQTQSGLARIVDMSNIPRVPVEPRKNLIILIGLMLGGIVSVGFVGIREFLRQEISSIDKLMKKGYPILAVVPDMTKQIKQNFDGSEYVTIRGKTISTSLIMVLDSISPIAESFRRLQSNVLYSQPDNPLKTIIVTSANKSEGKSTVSTNLAIALAEAGRKVLIVDFDFRRPRIHSILGLQQEPGSMDILFNNAKVEDIIQPTLIPNVFALTSGKRPPNPAEITRSAKLRELVRNLKSEYDHIIIDSPPFGIISDAAPLIQESDGVVLAVRFNQTKSPELDLTVDNLSKVKANVIGTVMTAFDPKQSTGYYYTSYYYKYAYESYDKYHEKAK